MTNKQIYLELDSILSQADHKGFKENMWLFNKNRLARLIDLVNRAHESGNKIEIE